MGKGGIMKATFSLLIFFFSYVAGAAKTYQVTGPILELNDARIIIQKGQDKWEIERTPGTKISGDLKVGEKVTVEYTMAADKIDTKETKKKK